MRRRDYVEQWSGVGRGGRVLFVSALCTQATSVAAAAVAMMDRLITYQLQQSHGTVSNSSSQFPLIPRCVTWSRAVPATAKTPEGVCVWRGVLFLLSCCPPDTILGEELHLPGSYDWAAWSYFCCCKDSCSWVIQAPHL